MTFNNKNRLTEQSGSCETFITNSHVTMWRIESIFTIKYWIIHFFENFHYPPFEFIIHLFNLDAHTTLIALYWLCHQYHHYYINILKIFFKNKMLSYMYIYHRCKSFCVILLFNSLHFFLIIFFNTLTLIRILFKISLVVEIY